MSLPSDESEALTDERIASSLQSGRAAQRSESRWFWATIICRVVIAVGAILIAGALVQIGIAGVQGEGLARTCVAALVWAALGTGIVLVGGWGHRYAWAHAFPSSTRR
ncbi:MAG: hypothetical protein ACKVU4_05410 [Phycisphaerales bacterium]